MSQHYTRNAISVPRWCNKHKAFTDHRIDPGRVSYCLRCIADRETQHQQNLIDRKAEAERAARQGRLFA